MRWIRWISQALGALVLLAFALSLLFAIVVALRIATYEQTDDEARVARKTAYLSRVATEAAVGAVERGGGATGRGGWPNLLIILFDDLGFGDLGVYGAESIATPHIDALARGGLRLDHYYAPSPVCSPSRAAMLTGRYAPRAGFNIIAFPDGHPISSFMKALGIDVRLPAEEILLSEILSAVGYRTGMVGKWHLGDEAPSLPTHRGFDSYLGALYSNDMTPFALYRGESIEFEAPFDQTRLTEVYTEAALEFLDEGGDEPFFLYYAHNFPHIPLFAPQADAGRSKGGLYGDVVEGLDDSVGRILDRLAQLGELENTLVLLTSDNGPWYEGDPGRVRGRKNQTWEGGMRVPFIAHWPARVAAGRESDAPVVGVDLVPTMLSLLDLPAPDDRMLDGIDITDLLLGERDTLERLVYYFGTDGRLDAVRDSRFKLHRRRGVRAGGAGDWLAYSLPWGPWLFDLSLDPTESYDTSRRHPEALARLAARFDAKTAEMQENPRGWR